jgi:hypothetical protein
MAEHIRRLSIEHHADEPIDFDDDDSPIDLDSGDEAIEVDAGGGDSAEAAGPSKIQTFGAKQRHGDQWDRTPNVTGKGAIHCKVFHCKLREDALEFIEEQINRWLDSHPEYEVKFVTSAVGELKTKTMTEPAMFVTVWV